MRAFHRCSFLTIILCGLLIAPGTSCPAADASTVLIRAENVYTMTGEKLSPGMVLVRDGKVVEVAPDIAADSSAKVIEVHSLMPGLVNARSTAGVVGSGGEASREVTPEFETAGMIDFDSRDFLEAVAGGETTVHIMPSTDNVIAGWTCIVKTHESGSKDRVIQPRRGVAISMCSDPAGRNRSRSRPESIYVRQPTNRMGVVWILRNELQRAKRAGTEKGDGATGTLAKMLGGQVTAFGVSRTSIDILSLMTISQEFGFKPILVGGHESYETIDELVASKTSVVYTAVDDSATGSEGSELFWATPLRLREAEIPFCIAGDQLLERMRLAVRFGLTADQAMASVTKDAADLLGLDGVGKLQPVVMPT